LGLAVSQHGHIFLGLFWGVGSGRVDCGYLSRVVAVTRVVLVGPHDWVQVVACKRLLSGLEETKSLEASSLKIIHSGKVSGWRAHCSLALEFVCLPGARGDVLGAASLSVAQGGRMGGGAGEVRERLLGIWE
jgi:hypothetical protein